jgi:hypothetical protein
MSDEQSPGTTNARLSRLEAKYDDLAKQVEGAVSTITRVELNQTHAEELNKLRFGSLDSAVGSLSADLKGFMTRIDGLVSGEQTTAQGRQMLDEYMKFKTNTERRLDEQDVRNGQISLVARVTWGLLGANVIAIISAILYVATGNHI